MCSSLWGISGGGLGLSSAPTPGSLGPSGNGLTLPLYKNKLYKFKMQKRSIRNMVGGNKMDSCKPHFKTLRMLTVY
jgi:hypothetical protein